jgi:hypothetical protein
VLACRRLQEMHTQAERTASVCWHAGGCAGQGCAEAPLLHGWHPEGVLAALISSPDLLVLAELQLQLLQLLDSSINLCLQ